MSPLTPGLGDLITYRFGPYGMTTLGIVLEAHRHGTWRGFTVTVLASRGDTFTYDVGDDEVALGIFSLVALRPIHRPTPV